MHPLCITYTRISYFLYLNHLSNNLSSFSFRSSIFCSIISNRDEPALLVLDVPLSKLKPRPRFALRSSLIQIFKLMLTGCLSIWPIREREIIIDAFVNLPYCSMIRTLEMSYISHSEIKFIFIKIQSYSHRMRPNNNSCSIRGRIRAFPRKGRVW